MSDDIVVIDNGQTYETQETSIVAKEEADRAERWAKFAEEQANLASGQAIEAAEASDAAAQAATAASASEVNAKASETNAKIWADGTDSEVQALGGVHSSKGWSEIAKDGLPSQAGNAGKFLTTDGTNASWGDVTSSTITYWE